MSVILPLTILLLSMLGIFLLMPHLLDHLRRRGLVVRDMYKAGTPSIVTHAGLLGLGAAVVALLITIVLRPPSLVFFSSIVDVTDPVIAIQLALFTICGYGIVGAIDDRHSLPHLVKAAVPVSLSAPVVVLITARPNSPGFLALFPLPLPAEAVVLATVVPVYILAVTNLVNMHSGFNGLQSGVSLILLGTLIGRLAFSGRLEDNMFLVLVAGSVAGFYPFNRYPAKAIEGNVGSFLVGATIGVGIVANGLFLAGIVMLSPHVLDFLLFVYGKASGRPFIKFGSLRPDGTISAPYPFKMKFLPTYYFRLTERQAVHVLYAMTFGACVLSLLIPV